MFFYNFVHKICIFKKDKTKTNKQTKKEVENLDNTMPAFMFFIYIPESYTAKNADLS